MKKHFIAAALGLITVTGALAQTTAKPLHFVAGAGVTFGGDKLATTHYTDGSSSNITAGSGLALLVGAEYRVAEQFSVQGTVGYHIRFTPDASNGDADFRRVPVELLGYYHINDQWRVGAGVRFVSNARLHGSGAASGLNADFDNTTGAVLEGEYFVKPNVGLKLRAVREQYTPTHSNVSFSGNHIGMLANFYF
ncbi:hypothetical protein H3H36_22485 [Duganella sp. FT3S]|uniref:Outer membrane protein beta-barrel domain-containing protein n=1 Tax=Rugamonas fusca TaxID=2758568 RepID=A0A7W2I931_9BURK|nr:hypothetical protein [Rugamonas fusca]MBA5608121.1 hypothetical protein [Rugamonas fusca]